MIRTAFRSVAGASRPRRGPRWRGVAAQATAILVLALAGAVAFAQSFSNPGFESGLTDWSTGGGATTVTGYSARSSNNAGPVWTVSPYTGTGSMLQLGPNGSPETTAAWDTLDLSQATRDYLTGIFPNTRDYAFAYRDVALAEGETFTMAWNYVATDYCPYNDGSFAMLTNLTDPAELPLIDGEVGDLRLLGVTCEGGNYVTGEYGSTGWQTITFQARRAGTYRLGFAAFNLTDMQYPPFMFVDEASGETLKDGEVWDPIPRSDDPPPPQVEPDAVVTTGAATNVTSSTADLPGEITDPGASSVTAHGHVWSTSPSPTTSVATKTDLGAAAGAGAFSSSLTGLAAGTTYYVRAYAVNANGTAYGNQVTFTTTMGTPTVTTGAVGEVTGVSATAIGSLVDLGDEPVTAHGHVWSTSPSPTTALTTKTDLGSAAVTGSFESDLAGLELDTTYYVRAYATNNVGTAYGSEETFTTPATPPSPEIATSAGTSTFSAASGPVVVDPALTVSGADVNGATVSVEEGFAPGDALAATAMHGVSATFDAATGVLTLTGTATAAQYQEILRTVTFSTTNPSAAAPRTVTFNLAGGALYLAYTGHFYEYVQAPGTTWLEARDFAEQVDQYGGSRRPVGVYGLQGYLVTVTSAEESAFVASKIQGQGWMGASDAAEDKIWRWMTGPEAGTHFFTQTGYVDGGTNTCGSGGSAVGGAFHNFASGEPNDWGATGGTGCANGENYAHFFVDGTWNDYAFDNTSIDGYVVEYGTDAESGAIASLTASKVVEVQLAPTIASFSPTTAGTGDEVVISGANLTGATSVTFGGVEAYAFTVVSDTEIRATLASGATGDVRVVTPFGTATRSGFQALPPGSVYVETTPGGGRTTLPADHPILADGVIAPSEYAGDLSLDPGAGGSLANLAAGVALHVTAAVDVVVASPFDVGARAVTLTAGPTGTVHVTSTGSIAAEGDVTLVAPSWTNDAGSEAVSSTTGRVRIYTVTPLDDQPGGVPFRERFGVTYPDDPVVSGDVLYYEASLVEGHAYLDADRDGVFGAGDAPLAGLAVTVDGTGTTVATDADGRYRIVGLAAGTYVVAVAPPAGHAATAGSERTVTLGAQGVVQDVDVAFTQDAFVSGHVFLDDGAGVGAPNDGVRDGDEAGVAGVVVTATHASGVTTATTGPDGRYDLYVPAGPVTLSHEATVPTGRNDGATVVLADAGTADVASFTVEAGAAYTRSFGVVNPGAIGPNVEGALAAPGARSYRLSYRPGTQGQVTFSVDGSRFAYQLRLDGACVGVPGEVVLEPGVAIAVTDAWPRGAAGLVACDVTVRVQTDAGESPGYAEAAAVTAELDWSGQSVADARVATVRTEVAQAGRLELVHEGRTLDGGGFSTWFDGAPGDTIEYRIRFSNPGASDVFDVTLRAFAHGAAEVLADGGAADLVCPDGSTVSLALTSSLVAVDLDAHCSLAQRPAPDGSGALAPALRPGEAGELRYRVHIP